MRRRDFICGLAIVDPKPIEFRRPPVAASLKRLKGLASALALLRGRIEGTKVLHSGACSLPVRRQPSKHCATLDFSRRLRMVGSHHFSTVQVGYGRRSWRADHLLSALALSSAPLQSAEVATPVDVAIAGIGNPPTDFEFRLTGQGEPGRWTVVADPSTASRVAIEHVSRDLHEDRFPLAIYNALSVKNVEIATRFKIVAGTIQTAGLAARLVDHRNYYAVAASALDSRVDLYRVVDGKMERIAGADADIFRDHWQTLALLIENDRFTVSLDNKPIFTAWDRTFSSDGRVALWTGEDNVTRFDQIEITPLPWSEQR
jgi:hypothetical protein